MRRLWLRCCCLISAAVLMTSCAAIPPQIRPTSTEPFVGRWVGHWSSEKGPHSGAIELEVTKLGLSQVTVVGKLSGSVVPEFTGTLDLRNGELVASSQAADLRLKLHGEERLEAVYALKTAGDYGSWSLARASSE